MCTLRSVWVVLEVRALPMPQCSRISRTRHVFQVSFLHFTFLHLGCNFCSHQFKNNRSSDQWVLQVETRVLSPLLKLPSTLQSLHINGDHSITAVCKQNPFYDVHVQLLRSQAQIQPLYPHLTYLVFQGPLPMTTDGKIDQVIQTLDTSCGPEGTVQVLCFQQHCSVCQLHITSRCSKQWLHS